MALVYALNVTYDVAAGGWNVGCNYRDQAAGIPYNGTHGRLASFEEVLAVLSEANGCPRIDYDPDTKAVRFTRAGRDDGRTFSVPATLPPAPGRSQAASAAAPRSATEVIGPRHREDDHAQAVAAPGPLPQG
jgi:hypothetical protein